MTTQELFEAIQKLRNAPTETKTQRLLEVLDEDKDGAINLEELRKVPALWISLKSLRLNCPKYIVLTVPYFPYSDWIWRFRVITIITVIIVNLSIRVKYLKIRDRRNTVFGQLLQYN